MQPTSNRSSHTLRQKERAALRSTAGGGGRARATLFDELSVECHMLTSSLLLVADGAADCLELAAQRDDVVNWPVLTIVVRPVLEIARSLGVRPPARSRARRSSAPLRALRTRYDHRAGSDAYFDACPTHCWAFGAKHRLPTSDTSPQGPSTKRNGNADSKSSMQGLPESRSPAHWPEPVKPVQCHSRVTTRRRSPRCR